MDNGKTSQILWNVAKAVLTEKCIALKVYIEKDLRDKISNLSFHLREKKRKLNPKQTKEGK